MGGIDGDRVGRARQGDDAGARAQRGAGREPRGAGPMRRAAEDENRAAGVFVAFGVGVRQCSAPDGGRVDEGLRRDPRQRGIGNADVGKPDRAAERAARQQQVARLQAEEGDARARLDRDAANLAARAVDARGDVDCKHPPAGAGERIDALDDRFRLALDVAREASAEQGVDHAIGAAGIDRRGVEDLAVIARRGERRIAS